MMFNIHAVYSPADIKDTIGWADHPTISDLVQAIMVLCDAVSRLEARVAALEPKWPGMDEVDGHGRG